MKSRRFPALKSCHARRAPFSGSHDTAERGRAAAPLAAHLTVLASEIERVILEEGQRGGADSETLAHSACCPSTGDICDEIPAIMRTVYAHQRSSSFEEEAFGR
jgi:hypothetical protein